jgi:hypothetical protein
MLCAMQHVALPLGCGGDFLSARGTFLRLQTQQLFIACIFARPFTS